MLFSLCYRCAPCWSGAGGDDGGDDDGDGDGDGDDDGDGLVQVVGGGGQAVRHKEEEQQLIGDCYD